MSAGHQRAYFLLVMWIACSLWLSAQCDSDYERAVAEFRAGNYAQAAARFSTVEAAAPGRTDALLYRAKSLVHVEDFAGGSHQKHLCRFGGILVSKNQKSNEPYDELEELRCLGFPMPV